MFLDKLIKKEISEKEDIKANIINIFNQRSSASLDNYQKLISDKSRSPYKYYGIVDIVYVTESNLDKYANHVEKALILFETRINKVTVDVQLNNLVLNMDISYKTHSGETDNIQMKLTRR